MRIRWSVILPFIGLILFTAVTIRSAKLKITMNLTRKSIFGGLRSGSAERTSGNQRALSRWKENCARWYQLPDRWIEPSLLDKAFVLSAIPVFLAGAVLVIGLSKLGVDEVLTFFVSMPILLFGWYLLRRLAHRALARSPCTHQKHSVEIRLSLRGICYPAAAALFDCIEAP